MAEIGKYQLSKAIGALDAVKQDREIPIPGVLGTLIDGQQIVEIDSRSGYVYVRLRDNQSELVQAFNDKVAPIYNLPVLVVRDKNYRGRYRVIDRDAGRYNTWQSNYVPRHGNQHSFSEIYGSGGDPVWVYGRQFMPLAVHPSGTRGSANVVIEPYTFYWQDTWHYAGGTGTASFISYNPTGTYARMTLVYIDENMNPQITPGDYFDYSVTGSVQVLPYIPKLPTTGSIPLAGIRLTSGTQTINWANIYDLRPMIVGDGFIATGTRGHIIQDESVSLPARPTLNFKGVNVWALDNVGTDTTDVVVSGSSIIIQDESVDLPPRKYLNFKGGSVWAVDNGGSNSTDVTISGTTPFASLAEAQAGAIDYKAISPSTLPVWVINNAFIRRDGYGGNQRGNNSVDLQNTRSNAKFVAAGAYSVVSGGQDNLASGTHSVVVGGYQNSNGGDYSVIVGGNQNQINHTINNSTGYDVIGGGDNNIVRDGEWHTISGGEYNEIRGSYDSNIAGGYANVLNGRASTIGGGDSNVLSGTYSVIPGGRWAEIYSDYAFGFGFGTRIRHDGAMLLCDQPLLTGVYTATFNSAYQNEFAVRGRGGIRFVTAVTNAGTPASSGTFQIKDWNMNFGGDANISGTSSTWKLRTTHPITNKLLQLNNQNILEATNFYATGTATLIGGGSVISFPNATGTAALMSYANAENFGIRVTPAHSLDVVAASAVSGTGTISTSGTADVTGSGTAFMSEVRPGDMLVPSGKSARLVMVVMSDTSLLLNSGYSPDISGLTYTIRRSSVNIGDDVFTTHYTRMTPEGTYFNILDSNNLFGNTYIRISGDTTGIAHNFYKARGTTDSPSAVIAGDVVGGMTGYAHDGTQFDLIGGYRILTESISGGNVASYLEFRTSTTGGSVAERARFSSAGYLGINATSPGGQLHAKANAAATIAEIVQAAVSQTAHLVEHQDSAGNIHNQFCVPGAASAYENVFNEQGSPYLDTRIESDSYDAVWVDASANELHLMRNAAGKISHFGVAAVAQQTGCAVPTDLATCITAITALRTALNNLGLTTVV